MLAPPDPSDDRSKTRWPPPPIPSAHTAIAGSASPDAVAVVEDGRFVRLEPDPAHPTGKALCAKGRAPPKLVDHPKRVTRPLGRTRPTGNPDGANLNLIICTAVLDPVSGTASYRSYLRDPADRLTQRRLIQDRGQVSAVGLVIEPDCH